MTEAHRVVYEVVDGKARYDGRTLAEWGVPVRRTHDLRELYAQLAPASRERLDADEPTVAQLIEIAGRTVAVAEEALG